MAQKQKITAGLLFLSIISMAFYPLFYTQATAFSYTPVKPFGGKITKIQACQAPPGLVITVGPPVGGKYFFNPVTSQLHAFGVVKPSIWVLGAAAPVPIFCAKGSTKSLGGFDVPGLASAGGLSIAPDLSIVSGDVVGAVIHGPLGDLAVGGSLGEFLGNTADTVSQSLGSFSQSFGSISGPLGAITSFASGDFFGGGLTLVSMFDPTGVTAAINTIFKIFDLLGINFLKKPPSLGLAYPILHIGTSR